MCRRVAEVRLPGERCDPVAETAFLEFELGLAGRLLLSGEVCWGISQLTARGAIADGASPTVGFLPPVWRKVPAGFGDLLLGVSAHRAAGSAHARNPQPDAKTFVWVVFFFFF